MLRRTLAGDSYVEEDTTFNVDGGDDLRFQKRLTVTLTDEGLEEAGPVFVGRVGWTDVVGIERSRTRTFVVLAPLLAIVIPATASEDEVARARFEQKIEERIVPHASAGR